MSTSKFTPLEPIYFLDEEWKHHEKVPGLPDGISIKRILD